MESNVDRKLNETILLVDDEEMVRHVCAMMLERLGYNVVSGRNGAEAFGIFKENPDTFDVVLTDIQMPEMSGTELARNIRSFGSDIPIILITGFGLDVPSEFMSSINISELVMKPIDMHVMAKIVRQALNSRSENRQERSAQVGGR